MEGDDFGQAGFGSLLYRYRECPICSAYWLRIPDFCAEEADFFACSGHAFRSLGSNSGGHCLSLDSTLRFGPISIVVIFEVGQAKLVGQAATHAPPNRSEVDWTVHVVDMSSTMSVSKDVQKRASDLVKGTEKAELMVGQQE